MEGCQANHDIITMAHGNNALSENIKTDLYQYQEILNFNVPWYGLFLILKTSFVY